MYQLTQCCCCFSLRMGTMIIGLLYLVGSTITLAGLAVTVARLYPSTPVHITPAEARMNVETMSHYGPLVSVLSGFLLAYRIICIVLLVLTVVQIVIDILLIVAAAKRKAGLAMPWMVVNAVLLIFNLAGFGAISTLGFLSSPYACTFASIAPLVVAFMYLVITIYVMIVVSSFYENFKKLY